jgi:hypothetical protein
MPVGMMRIDASPGMAIRIAITANVNGRRNASRTIHMVVGVQDRFQRECPDSNGRWHLDCSFFYRVLR